MTPPATSPPRPTARWWPAAVGTAAVLAVCAAVVAGMTRRAEAACPPQGRFVEVDGVRLHYLPYGSEDAAQTVVLLHGNGTMGLDFDLAGLAGMAAQRHRVIAFDRPGYGHSSRPDGRLWGPSEQADLLVAALDRLGVRDPIVLGHSWGASVALAMGVRHPQAVAALVLASGYTTPSLRLDVLLLGAPALPGVGALLRHTVAPLIGRLIWPLVRRRVFTPAPATPAFRDRYPVWMSLRPSQLKASATESALMIPMAVALWRRHRSMAVPTVVIAGADDRVVDTRWNASWLSERLPSSWLRVVEGSGHMVHHTATAQVMTAIDQAAALARARIEVRKHLGPADARSAPAVRAG